MNALGIDEKILEAYQFICQNYALQTDDIFLIGFSRGAFTVRCVANLIHHAGLLTKEGLYYLRELYDLWFKVNSLGADRCDAEHLNTSRSKLKDYARHLGASNMREGIRIRACAVWDTVGTLGAPPLGFLDPPAPTRFTSVWSSDLLSGIDYAFQALSLYEHRQVFLPIVWKTPHMSTEVGCELKQCWFTGWHADIGGGKKADGFAHLALLWIIANLGQRQLLTFDYSLWKPDPEIISWRETSVPDRRLQGERDHRADNCLQEGPAILFRYSGN